VTVWTYTILSVCIVSLISFIGVFSLALARDKLQKILLFLVSFAAGGLFGDAFIYLLPESFKKLGWGLALWRCWCWWGSREPGKQQRCITLMI
jgi:zinc transporter ZupT